MNKYLQAGVILLLIICVTVVIFVLPQQIFRSGDRQMADQARTLEPIADHGQQAQSDLEIVQKIRDCFDAIQGDPWESEGDPITAFDGIRAEIHILKELELLPESFPELKSELDSDEVSIMGHDFPVFEDYNLIYRNGEAFLRRDKGTGKVISLEVQQWGPEMEEFDSDKSVKVLHDFCGYWELDTYDNWYLSGNGLISEKLELCVIFSNFGSQPYSLYLYPGTDGTGNISETPA